MRAETAKPSGSAATALATDDTPSGETNSRIKVATVGTAARTIPTRALTRRGHQRRPAHAPNGAAR